MNSFIQKITVWIVPALMLGMITFLPGCSASREYAEVQKTTTNRDGMLHGTLDFSSGADATGSILVEKVMPSKVTVGKPFEYILRVTNRTDCRFSDVVVSEKFPEKYEMLKASLEPTKVSGRTAEWTIGELGPKEIKTITIRGTALELSSMLACTKAIAK